MLSNLFFLSSFHAIISDFYHFHARVIFYYVEKFVFLFLGKKKSIFSVFFYSHLSAFPFSYLFFILCCCLINSLQKAFLEKFTFSFFFIIFKNGHLRKIQSSSVVNVMVAYEFVYFLWQRAWLA